MTLLWLFLITLAAWRITSLIARERGLFAAGTRLRALFGVHHDPDGTPAYDETGALLHNPVSRWRWVDAFAYEIAEGMTCIWCCSVWVSLAVTLTLFRLTPELVYDGLTYALVALAMSAGVIVLDRGVG